MPRNVPVARQAQLLAVIAVAGAAPLTVGVILWVIGTVLQAGYHGRWAATAGTGEALMMAGLLCGLCMFVLAANSVRWTPRVPAGRVRRMLQPLASPEQQAWLADQPWPEPGLPSGPPGPGLPGPGPRELVHAPGEFPPDRPWTEAGPPPGQPAYPDPGEPVYLDPQEIYQPYLAHPGHPDPGGRANAE